MLGVMAEIGVRVDGVVVPAAEPRTVHVAGGDQIGHDGLHGALREVDDGRDVAHPRSRITRDLDQHVSVPAEQRPASVASARLTHIGDRILARGASREVIREDFFMYRLTCIPERLMLEVVRTGTHC